MSDKPICDQNEAILVLEDGQVYVGEPYGAEGKTTGEIVFATAMTGYQETLTDPSYDRQIVVQTFPHIGDTGVNSEDPESARIWVAGYVVRDPSPNVSNWRAEGSLDDDLTKQGIVGISGIDTRKLVRHLRSAGVMRAGVFSGEALLDAKGKVTGVKNGSCTIYTFCGGGFDAVGLTVSGTATNIPDSGKKPTTTTTKLTDRNTTLTLPYTKAVYNVGNLKGAVRVKHGSKTLTRGEDYTVSYHHNSEPGTATAKITGTGKYTGSLSKTFQITALTASYVTTAKINYRTGPGTK